MKVRSAITFLHWCTQRPREGSSRPDIDLAGLRFLALGGFIEIHSRESVRCICGITSAEEAAQSARQLKELQDRLSSTFAFSFLVKSRMNWLWAMLLGRQVDRVEKVQDELRSRLLASHEALRAHEEFVSLGFDEEDTYVRLTPHGGRLVERFVNAGGGTPFLESPTSESEIGVFCNPLPWHGILTIKEINQAARSLRIGVTERLLMTAVDLDRRWNGQFRPCTHPVVVEGRGELLAEAYKLEGLPFLEERKATEIFLSEGAKLTEALHSLSPERRSGFYPAGTESIVVGNHEPTDDERESYVSIGWSYGYDGGVPDRIEVYGQRVVLCRLIPDA